MDPFTIVVGCLAIGSWLMNMVQAVETYTLWKMQKVIPQKIDEGVQKTLDNPKTITRILTTLTKPEFMKEFSRTLAKRLKAISDGFRGYDESQKRELAAAISEDGEVSELVGLLPKRAQELLKKNPVLLDFGLQLAGPLIKDFIAKKFGGELIE